jgi:membrane associated rhomboid family serine protease
MLSLFSDGLFIYLCILGGASLIGFLARPRKRRRLRDLLLPPGLLWSAIAIPTVIQLTYYPALLAAWKRDTTAVMSGEVWRLVTAVFVQGGYFGGALFNLITLAVVAPAANALFGWRRMLLGFGLGCVGGEISALWLLPTGAGNSVGVFGMAGAIAMAVLLRGRIVWLRRAGGLVCLLAIFTLTWLDIHGFAFLTAAFGFAWLSRHDGKNVRY